MRIGIYDGDEQFSVTEKNARQRFEDGSFGDEETGRPIAGYVVVKHFRPNVRIVRAFVELTEERNGEEVRQVRTGRRQWSRRNDESGK